MNTEVLSGSLCLTATQSRSSHMGSLQRERPALPPSRAPSAFPRPHAVHDGRAGVFRPASKVAALTSVPFAIMEDSPTETACRCLDETFKGVVRIRLYEYDTDAGRRQAIELTAWNSWAGQAKLISFSGGLDPATARAG